MIKYEQWPKTAIGGQHVGTSYYGVKGAHYFDDGMPSGIEACCGLHRSQHKNRMAVDLMINAALETLE